MKRCPSCRRIFTDDASVVCSYDGSPLLDTIANVDLLAETLETPTDAKESPVSEHLIFKRDDSSIVKINKKRVIRRAILTMPITYIAIPSFVVWVIVAGALAQPPSNTPINYILVSAGILLILVIVSSILWEKNADYRQLYSYKEPIGRMGKYIGQGRFGKKIEDDNYIIYKMFMPCTYPTCDGIVYISDAPSDFRKFFTGRCILDPNTHDYKVDANGLAAKATKNQVS